MSEKQNTESAYPPPSNPVMNVLRTGVCYPLLGAQLAFFLFVLELPYWISDKFFSRQRGDAFYRGQRRIAKWFFRLYPFGRQRHVNVRRASFPRPCVIVCNHQSTLDILMTLMLPVNARWLIKGWPFRYPLMGELNKLARHIRIDEPDPEKEDEGPRGFDTASDWLKRDVSILVFPEGSRSSDGEIKRFRNGAFLLAIEAGVPVVPVVLDGTGACVRKGSPVVNDPDVVMKVLEPVPTDGLEGERDASDLKHRVRERMIEELKALRAAENKPSFPRIHGWVTRLGMAGVAMLLALAVGVSVYVNNWCIAEPPRYDGDRALADTEVVERTVGKDKVRVLGENWRRDRDGVHEIGLTGDPWERGYANARLTRDLTKQQEELLVETAEDFFSDPISLWAAKHLLAINNRRLPEHVTEREKLEVLGLTEGSVNHYPDEAPLYHRILNYHAAHDISHVFIDNPLVTTSEFTGCTGFAAWGDATRDGDIIIGRNFDFEAGDVFDKDKAILYVWPDDGHAYVHVAWAGMAGAVTGMNEHGLSIHINAARTSEVGFGRIGTPVSMIVRRVLEQCRTIDEAYALIEQASVFVSDTYMVASRDDGRAVVIEKSPGHCAMREAGREGLLLQTNHMLTAPLKDDPTNVEAIERATTAYRWARLEELTDSHYGEIDRDVALGIVRDRKGRGDKEIGLGNRNAIDASICAHSVIMNVTTGEMWVSAAPNTWGAYLHVNVELALRSGPRGALRMSRAKENNLPRDPARYRADDLETFKKARNFARGAIGDNRPKDAAPHVQTMRNTNPDSFETAYWEGRLAYLNEDYKAAADSFRRALDRDPHYESVREDIRQWLQRAEKR